MIFGFFKENDKEKKERQLKFDKYLANGKIIKVNPFDSSNFFIKFGNNEEIVCTQNYIVSGWAKYHEDRNIIFDVCCVLINKYVEDNLNK